MAHSRIDDLRRRVEADPASIAFAQLAEEYRRAGQTEEAVRVSREGLTRHPGYLSARVTLGRALLDLGQLAEARTELQFVATEAPENLAAVRGLAEIFHREGDIASALEYFQRGLSLARHDPELEEIVQQLSRQVGAQSGPSNGLSFEEAHQELLSAADRMPLAPVDDAADPLPAAIDDAPGTTAPFDFDTLVAALGTPAAPPLVEAVVRGETPEVFELPEPPAVAGNPFAALEAQLRAQPADEGAAVIAETPAGLAAAEMLDEGWLTRNHAPPESPGPETPPDPAWIVPALDAAEWDQALDASVAALLAPEPEPVAEATDLGPAPSEAAMAEVEPSGPVVDGPVRDDAAEVPTAMAEADVAPVAAEPAAEAPAAPEDARPPVGTPRGDDVLGDLEDWLNTLQDRSEQ